MYLLPMTFREAVCLAARLNRLELEEPPFERWTYEPAELASGGWWIYVLDENGYELGWLEG